MSKTFTALTLALVCSVMLGGMAPAQADIDAWPLLEFNEDATTVIYPFHVREGDFHMNFPIYYQTNDGKDQHIVWPLVKFREGRLTRVAPFWFSSDTDEYTLFPVIHRSKYHTITAIPPAYFGRTNDFHAILPLYVTNGERLYALPGYYRHRIPGRRKLDGVLGLARWEHDETTSDFRLLANLVTASSSPGHSKLSFGYLYHQERSPDHSKQMLLPLYYASKKPDAGSFYMFPYYKDWGPDLERHGVLPLFETEREGDRKAFHTLIYAQSRSPKGDMTRLTPVFKTEWKEVGNSGDVQSYFSVLGPIYANKEIRTISGDLRMRHRRFAFFTDKLEQDGTRTFAILGIPVRERVQGATGLKRTAVSRNPGRNTPQGSSTKPADPKPSAPREEKREHENADDFWSPKGESA